MRAQATDAGEEDEIRDPSTEDALLVAASAAPTGLMAQAILDMLDRADRAVDVDPQQARRLIGQASRLLAPALEPPPAPPPPPSRRRVDLTLAPWQERKVMRHIDERLGQPISVAELAESVGFSASHFSRCFKSSFGLAPRGFLIRCRLERAKTLMRRTGSPLCQIAMDCGFSDQAHMSRTFRAIVGSSPNRWRRAQASGENVLSPAERQSPEPST